MRSKLGLSGSRSVDLRHLLAVSALLPLAGCDLPFMQACTTEARAGISVEARDSITNELITDSALGFVREGSYRDTLYPPDVDTMGFWNSRSAAYERAGVYEVHLSRPGYHDWVRTHVNVTRGDCHVNTVSIIARMQPL